MTDEKFRCPWCGQQEGSEWLLQNNHWVKPAGWEGYDWCQTHGRCIAQDLTLNHVAYALKYRDDDALPRYYARALQLWAHVDPEPELLAEARDRLALINRPAPEHAVVVASEETSLW